MLGDVVFFGVVALMIHTMVAMIGDIASDSARMDTISQRKGERGLAFLGRVFVTVLVDGFRGWYAIARGIAGAVVWLFSQKDGGHA